MNEFRENRWLIVTLTLVGIVVAAAVAYNVGLSQGLAQVGAPATGGPPSYPYGWHRPWGGGFLFPLMFIFFWVVLFKGLFWWPWRPWSHYYGPPPHFRDRFDEWHRQAHERMGGSGNGGKT